MGYNKFVYDGVTKFDLTGDTVTPQTLAKGVTAHNAKGDPIVGTLSPEGGTGSDIIDVTELPTEGIDENAVYRLTETVQTSTTGIYAVLGVGVVISLSDYLHSQGIPTEPNIYEVDELPPDMKPSDIATFTELHFYVSRADGKCYIYASQYGMIVTAGYLLFNDHSYDKGSTNDVYTEVEMGVYTTLEIYRTDVIYFIRENGEWKRISPDEQSKTVEITKAERTRIFPDEGKTLSSVIIDVKTPAFGDLINGTITEIGEEHFRGSNGEFIIGISSYAFYNLQMLQKVTIKESVGRINSNAFYKCNKLSEVTFKGMSSSIASNAFYDCSSLTTINVPWAEGEVANAPWGATNATINYNYTEG